MPMSISSEFFKPSRSLPVCPSSLERIHEAIHVSVFDPAPPPRFCPISSHASIHRELKLDGAIGHFPDPL